MRAATARSRVTARLACVLALLAFGACGAPAAGAQAPLRPILFIEGFRTTDSLSRQAASALRVRMARLGAERAWPLHVMTTAEIDAMRDAGSPDDFGGAWSWADVREATKVYRAYAVIDVIAVSVPAGVRLEASRLHPVPRGNAARLPDVQAASLEEAVARLAERLAADPVVTQGK